ncbi:putative transcription factor C2H2 family [Medicago truncatula]|uniref:Putative transcription factor C2H2 family n=1 Tax=Medicago truncatula TaxID=3880 RepID=A0A072TK01_MEDTR|nr:zinc finger, C3HC4 type (RING finger) protein [Medicago truncatula]RHN38524.1 putative transcription factor C2H2 family [Medicago truncatula]
MSPLIRIALAINSFSCSHTLRNLMKYSTLLHIFLNSIFNFFFYYLRNPLCKHKSSDHHLSVCQYVSQSQKEVDCAVCLCTMKEKEEIRVLRCEHVFHKDCFDTWIRYKYNNTTCPLCRVSVGSIREVDAQVIVHDHFHELPWLR